MKKFIGLQLAGGVLLGALLLLAIFHLLVLLGLAPATIVWGGRVDPATNVVVLETVALTITLLFALIIALKIGYIRIPKIKRGVTIGMWLLFLFFVVNTLGNLASSVTIEKLVFTPITIILAVLAYRVAIEP